MKSGRIEMGKILFSMGAIALGGAISANAQAAPNPKAAGRTYFEFQVEKPVQPLVANVAPVYPTKERSAKVEGAVLAQFTVREDGMVDPTTFKVVRSTGDGFSDAVRLAVAKMRFLPAEIAGVKVKQLVQLPFMFKLSKDQ